MVTLKALAAAASSLVIAACTTVGPDHQAPDARAFTANPIGGDARAASTADEPAADWWRALNDPTLDAFVERAFAENRDLRVAVANVEAARALLNLERVNLRPTGEADASYQRRRLAGAAFGIDGAPFEDTDFFRLGAGASWELDFFGRVRRLTEAARADAEAADYLRRDAESLVAAETARAYVDYRGAELRLAVASRNLEVQRKTLALTRTRLEEGIGSRLDVDRAAAQAKSTEASIAPIEAEQAAAANRLATLLGSNASSVIAELKATPRPLPATPAALAVGDVASLLVRRADVRAAERALAAETARIGVAKAEYFPRVSLVGAVSASAQTLAGAGSDGALGYGVGPTLSWAGFDIPRVRAGVKVAGARAEAALAAYEQSVLEAIEDTQSNLSRYGRGLARYEALVAATKHATDAADLARERFTEGADDFIDVLDAEGRQLAAEAALADAQTAVTADYIAVYRALGAGWSEEGRTTFVQRIGQP